MGTLELPESLKREFDRQEARKHLEAALNEWRLGCEAIGVVPDDTRTFNRIKEILSLLDAHKSNL